jgi:anti-sigma factor RsiW
LEKFYTEYVCDLLDEEQVARVEEHLRGCSTCAHEVEALQKTLRLAEEAEELPIPPGVLDNIEMNVYKRLAAESPSTERAHFLSEFVAAFRLSGVKRRPTWIFRSALATLALVISISIATVFINQDQSSNVSISAIPIQSPHERIERYRQAEIRSNYTEALETRHLKGDDRLASLQLLVLAEQAP